MAELQEKARAVNGDRGQNSGYLWVKGSWVGRRHQRQPGILGNVQYLICSNSSWEVYVNIHQKTTLKAITHPLYVSYTGKISTPQNSTCTLGCKIFMPASRKICERSTKILSQGDFFPSLFLNVWLALKIMSMCYLPNWKKFFKAFS